MRLHFAESRGADFLQLRLSLFPNSEAIIIEILDKTSDALSQIRLAMRLVHQTDADELLGLGIERYRQQTLILLLRQPKESTHTITLEKLLFPNIDKRLSFVFMQPRFLELFKQNLRFGH